MPSSDYKLVASEWHVAPTLLFLALLHIAIISKVTAPLPEVHRGVHQIAGSLLSGGNHNVMLLTRPGECPAQRHEVWQKCSGAHVFGASFSLSFCAVLLASSVFHRERKMSFVNVCKGKQKLLKTTDFCRISLLLYELFICVKHNLSMSWIIILLFCVFTRVVWLYCIVDFVVLLF